MAIPTRVSFAGITNHVIDFLAISSTTEAAGYEAENVANTSLFRKTTRSTSASADWKLTVSLSPVPTVRVLSLLGTNLTNAATVKYESDSTFSFSSPTNHGTDTPFGSLISPDVLFTPTWGRHVLKILPTSPGESWWRFTINDTSNPDGYYRISHAIISDIVTPEIDPLPVSIDIVNRGPRHTNLSYRTVTLSLNHLKQAERMAITNLARSLSRTGRLLIILQPADTTVYHEEVIFGTVRDAKTSREHRSEYSSSANIVIDESFT